MIDDVDDVYGDVCAGGRQAAKRFFGDVYLDGADLPPTFVIFILL